MKFKIISKNEYHEVNLNKGDMLQISNTGETEKPFVQINFKDDDVIELIMNPYKLGKVPVNLDNN